MTATTTPMIPHDPHMVIARLKEHFLGIGFVLTIEEKDVEGVASHTLGKNYNQEAVDAACMVMSAAVQGNPAAMKNAIKTVLPEIASDVIGLAEPVLVPITAAILTKQPLNWAVILASVEPALLADMVQVFEDFVTAAHAAEVTPAPTPAPAPAQG